MQEASGDRSRGAVGRLAVVGAVLLAALSVAASISSAGRAGESGFQAPTAAVPTPDGGFLIADYTDCVIKEVSSSGVVSVVAGNGNCGDGGPDGDGGPATEAELYYPTDAVPTADGGFLISSFFPLECRVREVDASGTITTVAGVAGIGQCGENGDGGPATAAQIAVVSVVPFNAPGAAVPTPGSGFLIASGCSVRRVNGAGTISTVAGNKTCAGDSVHGTAVSCVPSLCANGANTGLASVSTNPGAPSPIWRNHDVTFFSRSLFDASCPTASFCALIDDDETAFTSSNPGAVDPTWRTSTPGTPGNLWSISCPSTAACFAGDDGGHVFTSTNPTAANPTWTSHTISGSSDIVRDLSCPTTAFCAAVVDGRVHTSTNPGAASPIWESKMISSFDGGLASISCPSAALCVVGATSGQVYVSTNPGAGSGSTWTPQTVSPSDSIVRGVSCPSTSLCVAVDDKGNANTSTNPTAATPTWSSKQVDDRLNDVSCASASLCVALGSRGSTPFTSHRAITTNPTAANPTWKVTNAYDVRDDDVPATTVQLQFATAAVPTADGGFLLAEAEGARIRRVSPGGIIDTVAGTGVAGYSGDGGPATSAQLNQPTAAVPTADGGFLISEYGSCIVREVSASGTISTVAGMTPSPDANCGDSGLGGPATAAQLYQPTAAVPVLDGSFVIGTRQPAPGKPANDAAVNLVSPGGTISSAVPRGGAATTHTLTVSVNGPGSVSGPGISCPTDCTETVAAGTVIGLTPTAAAGASFTGWSGACAGTGACNVTLDAAKSVTASFATDPVPDKTAPNTLIDKQPKKVVKTTKKKAKVKFEFSATEAGSSFECKLDGGSFGPCSSPKTYKVKTGKHSFEVRATDGSANTDQSPAKASWKVKRKKKRR